MPQKHWSNLSWAAVLLIPALCHGQELVNPFAGNPQTAADGEKVFLQSCAPCHGTNGEGAQGQAEGMRPPDLTRGEFNAGRRDEDLFRVISEGVRGTAMQSFQSLGADQIWRLVVFVRSLSAVTPAVTGDANAGETLFWGKGDCGRCHQIGSRGGRLGPDLSRSSRRTKPDRLRQSIVDPDADITPGYAVIKVVTRENQTVTAVERWLANFSARLMDESGKKRTFLRDEVNARNALDYARRLRQDLQRGGDQQSGGLHIGNSEQSELAMRKAIWICMAASMAVHAQVGPEAAMQAQQVPNSWISYGKNYLGWRYSLLAQITMANQLAPAWILPVGVPGNNETTPGRSTC